jgi:hypothetical protein
MLPAAKPFPGIRLARVAELDLSLDDHGLRVSPWTAGKSPNHPHPWRVGAAIRLAFQYFAEAGLLQKIVRLGNSDFAQSDAIVLPLQQATWSSSSFSERRAKNLLWVVEMLSKPERSW